MSAKLIGKDVQTHAYLWLMEAYDVVFSLNAGALINYYMEALINQ